MNKRTSGLAAGFAVLAGLAISAPGTAQAATPTSPDVLAASATSEGPAAARAYGGCDSNEICLYSGANGTGTVAAFKVGAPDLREYNMHNRASSLWNRTGENVAAWTKFNSEGDVGTIYKGDKGNINSKWNNKISSIKVRGHW